MKPGHLCPEQKVIRIVLGKKKEETLNETLFLRKKSAQIFTNVNIIFRNALGSF
jgi:hypothetical protein